MTSAQYAVIQYIADPARNEALNVGVLAWTPKLCLLRIDDEAAARVVRDNPHLERGALLYLEASLAEHLSLKESFAPERLLKRIDSQKGFPALISEPRYTSVGAESPEGLDEAVQRLLQRVVRPKRRAGVGPSLVDNLERQFRPLLLSQAMLRHHAFDHSGTGTRRVVDFYANSGSNLALDALRLSLRRADEIRLRADAEAFKIIDIKGANNEVRFLVYCDFSTDSELAETNRNARLAIESTGATVLTDMSDTVRVVKDAVPTA